jgi:hypothetical protein
VEQNDEIIEGPFSSSNSKVSTQYLEDSNGAIIKLTLATSLYNYFLMPIFINYTWYLFSTTAIASHHCKLESNHFLTIDAFFKFLLVWGKEVGSGSQIQGLCMVRKHKIIRDSFETLRASHMNANEK